MKNRNKKRNTHFEPDYEPELSLDEIARQHGYSDYADYCDEYYEGHTGSEMGEPAVWEPDLDDLEDDVDEYKSEDYCEGFADGYSEGHDEGYDEGYVDGWEECDSYINDVDMGW